MDIFDIVEFALEGILPGGRVKVCFVAPDDGTPEQKIAAEALNGIEEFDEDCLSGVCQSIGIGAKVLDSEGNPVRLYYPDGKVANVSDDE